MVVSGWYRNPLHLKALDGVSRFLAPVKIVPMDVIVVSLVVVPQHA